MIARIVVILAVLAASIASLPASPAEALFPIGSRIGFVPPPGFQVSKRFPGFENPNNGGSMIVLAVPPQAVGEIETSLTPEMVKRQGVIEDARETLPLTEGKAALVIGTEDDNGQKFRKWMFLAEIPEGAALAAVKVPVADLGTYTDDVVKASLATLAIRPSVPVEEQLSLLPFKLNELSGLFPVRVLPGAGVVLADPPRGNAAPSDQPVFVATIGQGGPEQAAERASFARNLLTGLSDIKDVHVVSGDMLRLGGGTLPTHEIQAEAEEVGTGNPVKLVQWVRFGPGVYIRMVGIVRADQWLAAYPRFRAVRDGIAPRTE
jgi:hypothetical protein